jgi:hypothetical protein
MNTIGKVCYKSPACNKCTCYVRQLRLREPVSFVQNGVPEGSKEYIWYRNPTFWYIRKLYNDTVSAEEVT